MLQYFSQERAVEDSQYTTEDFLFRWKKLERILAKEGVDGLLLATGLDARDCVHSAYLFNWLFLGLSGKAITINKYLDPIYSEIVLVVSPKGSHIFITPEAKQSLQTLLYSIPNCNVYCPTQKQYLNKQLLDTLKIAQFYSMTSKISKIGVFLGQNEDVKIIQKWPIIQSYALQPVGKTFFTLKHHAVNLSSKVSALFRNLDKHSLKNLVSRTAYSMEGHVKGALATIQLKSQQQRSQISQSSLQESLQEAVDIGLFESGNQQYKGLVRVLFGARTQTASASSDATIGGQKAEHLTIQHFDPYTKMKIWRSYFLNLNIKNSLKVSLQNRQQDQSFIVKNVYKTEQVENKNIVKQNALISLYVSLVQSVLQSISSVAKDYRNLNNQFVTKLVLAKINLTAKQIYGGEIFGGKDVMCQIESFDSFGEPRPIDFKDSISFKLTSTFYCLKLKLSNIPCPTTKTPLGSLIFSQNFLIQQGCYLLLTKKTPYFDYWKCQPSNEILSQLNPNYEFEKLGKILHVDGFKNRIFIPSQKLSTFHLNIPILNVKYYFHEKGLRIYNDKIGWLMLLYSQIHDLTMVNKIQGEWVLLRTKRNLLFDCLQNNILAIQFRGKPFDFLMKQVKSKQNPLQLTFIDELPPLLAENWYFCNEVLKKPIKQGAVLFQHQILLNDFLWSFIEAKQLMIINQMKDIKMQAFKNIYQARQQRKKQSVATPEGKHGIVIINGTYGAGKYKLGKILKRFGPNEVPCQIFQVPPQNIYKKLPTQTFIQLLQQNIQNSQIPLTTTILIILPSWVNSLQFIQKVQQKYHIKSIVTKINVSNFYNKNGQLTENVLTFCLPGYCQNIIVDTSSEEQSLINRVIHVIGSYNRYANVFRSVDCSLTTGQCGDVMNNCGFMGDYQSFLRNKYGAFYSFQQLADIDLHYIQFKLPIQNLDAIKNLKKSQGYLIDRAALLRQLLPKKKQAENSKDELMLGLYFLEQVLSVVRRRQKVPQIRSIKALVNFKQTQEQAPILTQVNWSNNYFSQIPSKQSSRSLGFSILCKRYSELQIRNFIESMSFKKILFGDVQIMRSIDSLTEAELKDIQKWAIQGNRFMEEGFYFDGYVLRNSDGFLVERHPNLERVVQGWIEEQNARVAKFNTQLRNKWNEYVANYKQ